jgi:hypothetical protein
MMDEKSERELELEQVPFRKADKSTWPRGVRSIGIDEADALGVDADGNLYWHGKRVETLTRVRLTWPQIVYAAIIAIATVAGACGAVTQGWAAYNDWACKVGWSAVACPPGAATVATAFKWTLRDSDRADPQTRLRLALVRRVER